MTPQAFSGGMTLLRDMFGREVSDLARGVYADTFRDMDDTVWLAAVRRCAATCRFMPVPAEINAAAVALACEAHGIQTPDDAWAHTLGVGRRWVEGASFRDRFDDATWEAVQAIGGIRVVALAEEGAGIARVERQFRAAYETAYRREAAGAVTRALPEPALTLASGVTR